MAQRKDLTEGEKTNEIKKIIDQIRDKHHILESCHQARRGKKEEMTVGDEDYELEGSGDDDDGGGGDDMAELIDIGLAYLEDEKKRRKETEEEKLDITTGGDKVTEGDYKERD